MERQKKMNENDFLKAVMDNPGIMNICARYVEKNRYVCARCGKPKVDRSYYHIRNNKVYQTGRLPVCKKCTEDIFNYFRYKYGSNKIAMERLCLLFDLCFNQKLYDKCGDNPETIVGKYIKNLNLRQYRRLNSYDLTRESCYIPYLLKM